MLTIQQLLRAHIAAHKISQKKIEALSGIPQGTVSNILNREWRTDKKTGERVWVNPSFGYVQRIALAIGLPAERLYECAIPGEAESPPLKTSAIERKRRSVA